MSEKVLDLVKEIRTNLSQTSSSQKDEVRVMRSMLNDTEFRVGIYGKNGKEGEYCPAEDARKMISSIISSTAKIPAAEAEKLAQNHEFSRAEATSMIGISKEFVNTFIETGRKLPLGPRESSNISLAVKNIPETVRSHPSKVGVNDDGSSRWGKSTTKVPAHTSLKVYSSCPSWLK